MALLTEAQVVGRARRRTGVLRKSAKDILTEETASAFQRFDVFLSHSSAEPDEILLGIKLLLEDQGMSVYVDKYDDPHLGRREVTAATAAILQRRMRQSGSLLYAHSRHSTTSRWMPWELGFFDGLKGRVAIVPVTRETEYKFRGEEYLGLYPYVTELIEKLWVHGEGNDMRELTGWSRAA